MKKFSALQIHFIAVILLLSTASIAQTPLEIFVSSRGTNTVKIYDENGNYIKDFINPGEGGIIDPEDIIFHPDGTVLLTGSGNTAIKRYNGITGAYIGEFSSGYILEAPVKMSIGPDSLIYVTQWGNVQDKVARFDLNGVFVDEFTSISTPRALGHIWDNDKNFYLALFGALPGFGTVHKFDSLGNDAGQFINTTILDAPSAIWWEKNGDMLVADLFNGTVLRYDSTGQFVTIFLQGMVNPDGIAILPNGDMLIGDWGVNAVHRFDSLGGYWGYFTSGNGLDTPNSIKIRSSLNVSVSELNSVISEFAVYPSAYNTSYTINFNLATEEWLAVEVLSLDGKKVASIAEESFVGGSHTLHWNYSDALAAGTYLVNIKGREFQKSKKLLVR